MALISYKLHNSAWTEWQMAFMNSRKLFCCQYNDFIYGSESLKTPMIKINEMHDNDNIMALSPHGCEALTFVDIIKTAGI